MKKVLSLLLFSYVLFSCSKDEIEESPINPNLITEEVEIAEEEIVEVEIVGEVIAEETIFQMDDLIGDWSADSAIIDGDIVIDGSCELGSTLVIEEDLFIDRFFQTAGDTCNPIFVNGRWELEDDVLTLSRNSGAVYLVWRILELTEATLRIQSIGGISDQSWEYSK